MLRYFNGFSYLPIGDATANAVADGWFGNTDLLSGATPGRFSLSLCMQLEDSLGTFSPYAYQAVGTRFTTATSILGIALKFPSTSHSVGQGWTLGLYDAQGGGGPQMVLEFTETGVIRMYRGGTLVATTPANKYHLDEWIWLEMKALIDNVSGLCEVRVNTETVISFIGDTQSGTPVLSLPPGWDTVIFGDDKSVDGTAKTHYYWCDMYILDNTGPNNTDYLGNVRVNTQLTVSPGDLTQFSVFGAGSNWDAVNDSALTDAEYVFDGTVGQKDLYTMNPNVVAQNIFGVQVRGAYRQDDSTQMVARNILKTGGVIYEGADHYLSGTYRYYTDIWELNPGTGVGWTAAQLNAIQAGTKVQA